MFFVHTVPEWGGASNLFFLRVHELDMFRASLWIEKIAWERCSRQKFFLTFRNQLRCAILEILSYNLTQWKSISREKTCFSHKKTRKNDFFLEGHLGVNKSLEKIRKRFYCATCKQDVEHWYKSCKTCIAKKALSN